MGKKILAISTSLRTNGNSETLLDSFIEGAKASGNDVEKITLKGKRIEFCRGCLACQKIGKCVIDDDSIEIVKKMKEAKVLVFATPIYYYEMCGQLKTLLDRANSLYDSDYKFEDVYVLSTAAEDDEGVDERAVNGVCGWIDCFERCSLKGTVFAGGVTDVGEIKNHPALKRAYEMGLKA